MIVVGFSGKLNAGKDTAADAICEMRTVQRLAFAKPLKDTVMKMFDLSKEQVFTDKKDVIDLRWNKTPRQLLQWFGTDVIRNYDPDHWVKLMRMRLETLRDSGTQIVVVTDVRFDNEADLLREFGATIVRINRIGLTNVSSHSSEDGLSVVDVELHNEGGVEEFKSTVKEWFSLRYK